MLITYGSGNALTDFFFKDTGITQNQFNIGQQLLSLGIVLLEVPSNYILYRVGPTKWISGQIIAWGLVATFQAFQHGVPAFMITRLLLGLMESGFIPAGLYTITRWYKNEETTKRFAWFFIGNGTAQACSGLVAYGVLQMRGVSGLGGWQWLFILEGILTLTVGVIFALFFPRSPTNPVNLFKKRYFNERETYILVSRVLLDDPTKEQGRKNVTGVELKRTFTNWRLIPHVLITICGLAPAAVMMSYAPTLIKTYGYGRLRSNAMVSIGSWIALIMYVTWGWAADKWGRRGPLVFLGMLLWWIFALCNRLEIHNKNNKIRFVVLCLGVAFGTVWHAVNGSWMAMNARSAGERSITLAIFIMSANTSGIVGSQLFQAKDGPLYPVGWSIIVALASVALFMTVVANVQYWLLNRKVRGEGGGEKDLYQT